MEDIRLVVGKEYLDYISKKSGKQVRGYNLHLQFEDNKVEGSAVEKVFVKEEMGKNVKVSDSIELFYDKFGKTRKIDIV